MRANLQKGDTTMSAVRYTTVVVGSLGLPFLEVLVSGPRTRSLNLLSIWESKQKRAEWVLYYCCSIHAVSQAFMIFWPTVLSKHSFVPAV